MTADSQRPRLREYRQQLGWTQQELADRLAHLAWMKHRKRVAVNAVVRHSINHASPSAQHDQREPRRAVTSTSPISGFANLLVTKGTGSSSGQ